MLIKCKLIREGGTRVRLESTDYHFTADKNGEHVAEVTNPNHIKKFLAISEAYIAKGAAEPEAPDTSVEDEAKDLFPLADANIDAFTNKELSAAAAKHLGITGTNKRLLADYAKAKLGIEDLEERDPKASYITLVRDVLLAVQARQLEERAEFIASSDEGGD